MFTGIVTAIGTVSQADQRGDLRLRITAPFDPARIDIGASIACSGVCLTVVAKGGDKGDAWFDVDVSGETVSRTHAGMWEEGAKLNLEPSLRLGDELGGSRQRRRHHLGASGFVTLEALGHLVDSSAGPQQGGAAEATMGPNGSNNHNGGALHPNEVQSL